MTCPHPGLQVGGRCYWCCKCAALNGHRSKLTDEQRGFVGVGPDPGSTSPRAGPRHWTQPNGNEQELESLQELLDTAPGWFALARKMLEPDKEESRNP